MKVSFHGYDLYYEVDRKLFLISNKKVIATISSVEDKRP